MNVDHLHETVATDTFFSKVPAIDDGTPGHGGSTMLQVYTGTTSHLTEGYPMSRETEMPATLQDFIQKRGAPDLLFSDCAKAETSNAVNDILRQYTIKDHQSEPYHQNQNPAEHRIQDIKHTTNAIMDRTGTPAGYWLLCSLYVVYLFNHLAHDSLDGQTPLFKAFGQVPDTSAFLSFHWWEPVYYQTHSHDFPTGVEKSGRWVGVAENQGDALTYLVLTDDTQKVIT